MRRYAIYIPIAIACIVGPMIPRYITPAPSYDDRVLVGVGCGHDRRIVVWAGEEDDIAPLFCDRIEAATIIR